MRAWLLLSALLLQLGFKGLIELSLIVGSKAQVYPCFWALVIVNLNLTRSRVLKINNHTVQMKFTPARPSVKIPLI